jgi:hypothetical protein
MKFDIEGRLPGLNEMIVAAIDKALGGKEDV